jgi:hypothetical protein
MTNEQLRMQMLAGIITEGQYKEKLNEIGVDEFDYNNMYGFKWNNRPQNPNDMLFSYDDDEEFSKGEFWDSDDIENNPEDHIPDYGKKNSDGTWTFEWDSGEIGGFKEGEDFIFSDNI